MPRELRISAVIRLPDDPFDEAEALVRHRPAIDEFKEAIGEAGEVEVEIVAPRPRGMKEAA